MFRASAVCKAPGKPRRSGGARSRRSRSWHPPRSCQRSDARTRDVVRVDRQAPGRSSALHRCPEDASADGLFGAQAAADLADGLAEPVLVLDQGQAEVAFARSRRSRGRG